MDPELSTDMLDQTALPCAPLPEEEESCGGSRSSVSCARPQEFPEMLPELLQGAGEGDLQHGLLVRVPGSRHEGLHRIRSRELSGAAFLHDGRVERVQEKV